MSKTNNRRLALYVCDDSEIYAPIADMMDASGFDVLVAEYSSNMFEGICKLPRLDAIVLDYASGSEQFEYCRELRNDSRAGNISIIAIVADEFVLRNRATQPGVDQYVKAPVDIRWFQRMLAAYCNG